MMKESIITTVLTSDGREVELQIIYEGDDLDFRIGDEVLFSGDWECNFCKVFQRARELWGGI